MDAARPNALPRGAWPSLLASSDCLAQRGSGGGQDQKRNFFPVHGVVLRLKVLVDAKTSPRGPILAEKQPILSPQRLRLPSEDYTSSERRMRGGECPTSHQGLRP